MAYTKPTLSTVIDNVKNNLFSRVTGSDSSLQNSFLNVLAIVVAGTLYGLYGFLSFVLRQLFPDISDAEYLERWATIFGLARDPAVKATGTVKFTGTDTTVIPLGTQVSRSDGVLFSTTAAGTIGASVSGEVDIAVSCDEFGETGNTDSGAVFTLTQTIAGVDGEATLQSPGATGGVERQTDASLRSDILERMRRPPRGGSSYDYEVWTKEAITTITRVFVRTYNENASLNPDELFLGQVKVYFMIDGTGNGIPTSPQVATVLAYLESKAEPTARIIVAAPVADSIDFEIDISPNTTETQADLNAALDDMIVEEGEPGGTITLTKVLKTVSAVASIDDFSIVDPVADIVSAMGEIPVKGTVTIGTL